MTSRKGLERRVRRLERWNVALEVLDTAGVVRAALSDGAEGEVQARFPGG